MKSFTYFFTLIIVQLLLLNACAFKANFDIRGDWEYAMTTTNGSTYDTGIITFSGKPAKGTYLEVNIYQVEYEGEFTVNGDTLTLTGGETWKGVIVDADSINGIWSHEEGSSGTFTASRK